MHVVTKSAYRAYRELVTFCARRGVVPIGVSSRALRRERQDKNKQASYANSPRSSVHERHDSEEGARVAYCDGLVKTRQASLPCSFLHTLSDTEKPWLVTIIINLDRMLWNDKRTISASQLLDTGFVSLILKHIGQSMLMLVVKYMIVRDGRTQG